MVWVDAPRLLCGDVLLQARTLTSSLVATPREAKEQAALKTYVREFKPLVVIMAPLCTPVGQRGCFNEAIHYDG